MRKTGFSRVVYRKGAAMQRIKKWLIKGSVVIAIGLLLMAGAAEAVVAIISVIAGEEEEKKSNASLEGLPPFITLEMVETLLEMQDTYGHPVSTGLAQVIVESGFGKYGPNGESGQGLSKLAHEDKNLFGIKYHRSDKYALGSNDYHTQEQTGATTAGFSVYKSHGDCIRQRSAMLEKAPYISHIKGYKKPVSSNGVYKKEMADGFMEGIRAAGWATSITYVQHCTSVMQTYNLYRFDNMTLKQFQSSGGAGGSAETGKGEEYGKGTAAQKNVVDIAYRTPFAGDGLCATWVSRVFAAAGQPYPTGNANSFTMSRESGGIKVGMVICVQHSGPRPNSWNYGHIGIYVGDGMILHNESSRTGNQSNGCTLTEIGQWKATYEYQCKAYYGWVNGIDLSK